MKSWTAGVGAVVLATAGCGPALGTQGNPTTVLFVQPNAPPPATVAATAGTGPVQVVTEAPRGTTSSPLTIAAGPATAGPSGPAVAVGAGPQIRCPAPQTVMAGASVRLQAEARGGDGAPLRVRWEVRTAPQNNRAYRFLERFDANDTDAVVGLGAEVPFAGVIVGDYTLVATARDAEGRTAECETQVAMTGHGLRVELSWNTDHTDVDLHATRGPGTPWVTPQDCYYAQRQPDTADPVEGHRRWLDTDDVDGEGPENIRVDAPQPDEDYNIGVHYYSSHGQHGPTRAIVMVYCGERRVARFERDLVGDRAVSDNDFWHVARVRFGGPNGCAVTPVQRVMPQRVAAQGG